MSLSSAWDWRVGGIQSTSAMTEQVSPSIQTLWPDAETASMRASRRLILMSVF